MTPIVKRSFTQGGGVLPTTTKFDAVVTGSFEVVCEFRHADELHDLEECVFSLLPYRGLAVEFIHCCGPEPLTNTVHGLVTVVSTMTACMNKLATEVAYSSDVTHTTLPQDALWYLLFRCRFGPSYLLVVYMTSRWTSKVKGKR